ncbi:MAG: hypothetical protein ABSD69_00720 [Candidatus Levyibacteriota bacterium]|jgi:hypothetical protein
MALSPESGSKLWGVSLLDGNSSAELLSQQRAVLEVGAPVNPRTLNTRTFQRLDGYLQEASLGFLLNINDLAKVAELRPDFDVYRPLSENETAVSYLVGEIIRRDKPIKPSSDLAPNSIFAQIYALGYPIGEGELVAKLERERERAKVRFPEAFFAPAEDIGSFCAARRYFASLEMALHPKAMYSRDYFRPLEPTYKENPSWEQRERDRRAQAAHDDYLRETELLGVPLF